MVYDPFVQASRGLGGDIALEQPSAMGWSPGENVFVGFFSFSWFNTLEYLERFRSFLHCLTNLSAADQIRRPTRAGRFQPAIRNKLPGFLLSQDVRSMRRLFRRVLTRKPSRPLTSWSQSVACEASSRVISFAELRGPAKKLRLGSSMRHKCLALENAGTLTAAGLRRHLNPN